MLQELRRFQSKREPRQAQEEDEGNDSDSSLDSGSSSGPNFNYILNMPLWCLTKEKVEELLKQRDLKVIRWRSSRGRSSSFALVPGAFRPSCCCCREES